MDYVSLLSNAISAGAGAFAGALVAYFLACRKEKKRKVTSYLSLLLFIYDQLDAVYSILKNIPSELVKEIDGKKIVEFKMPLPKLALTPQQMQTLIEVAPDKQMPSTLIHFSHFIDMQARRVAKYGVSLHEMADIQLQARQLKFMLMSVRVQYEQQTNAAFPLESSEPSQKLQ